MKRLLGYALAVSIVLGACGGAGSKDGGVVTAQATADKLGCAITVDPAGDRELFVADSGGCSLDGTDITIYRFSNNKTRDQWIQTASNFGVGRFVEFDRGVVTSDDQNIAETVQAKIGGKVRT